jgi:hypothetical protein
VDASVSRNKKKRSQRRNRIRTERRVDRAGLGGEIREDLEDQARWSSLTQHIPRLGEAYRNRIWMRRIYRILLDRRVRIVLAVGAGLLLLTLTLWIIERGK